MSRKEHISSARAGRAGGLLIQRFRRGAVAAAVIFTTAQCILARADDNASSTASPSPAPSVTPSPPPSGVPSPTPSATATTTPSGVPSVIPSKVKDFLISPEESDQDFMCESGRVQSVLAYAIAEHRIVSVTFLDQSKTPIAEGVWSSAYGFRLTHRQNVKINVSLICGN
jgi:hypothetical protein